MTMKQRDQLNCLFSDVYAEAFEAAKEADEDPTDMKKFEKCMRAFGAKMVAQKVIEILDLYNRGGKHNV